MTLAEINKPEAWLAILATRSLRVKGCIGYHGTSLETVEYLLKHGVLPGHTNSSDSLLLPREFYFNPRLHKFPLTHPLFTKSSWLEMRRLFSLKDGRCSINDRSLIEDCISHANMISPSHYFLKNLGLRIDDGEYDYQARIMLSSLDDSQLPGKDKEAEEYFLRFRDLGFSEKELFRLINKARQRKGVVMGLSSRLLQSYVVEEGHDAFDVKITVPEGLDGSFLSAIRPLGNQERAFLKFYIL